MQAFTSSFSCQESSTIANLDGDESGSRMRALVVLSFFTLLSGCSGYLLGDRQPAAVMTPEGGTHTSVRDSAISGEIRQRFNADDELSGYRLGISTSAGRVTLSGAVANYPARDRAVQMARATNGVSEVDNRIVVNTNL